jgi:uncharacterized membrane protein YkoI
MLKQLIMKNILSSIVLISFIAIGLNMAIPFVGAEEGQVTVRKLQESGQILSLEKITKFANAVKPGEILDTELERKKGRYIYEVELLDTKGQVWELKLDAKTGELIKLEIED